MNQFDMKTLETAIIYVKRIADGKNPVNNQPMPEDSVLNEPNVIRCMFFVRDVLEGVRANEGKVGDSNEGKQRRRQRIKEFPVEVLSQFVYREDKGISKLIDQIYEPVADQNYRKISGKTINERLMASGYLTEVYNEELKKNVKVPTEKGTAIGLRAQRIDYQNNSYISIYYNKNAQEFLIKNLVKLLDGEVIG